MKNCADCKTDRHDGGCNWLDWMVDEAGGVCPHCGGAVTEIETVTPLGRLMDRRPLDGDPPIEPRPLSADDVRAQETKVRDEPLRPVSWYLPRNPNTSSG